MPPALSEACDEALAPLAQGSGTLGQRRIVARQQQDDGNVFASELGLDHFLQTKQGGAHGIHRLVLQRTGGVGQPGIGIEACAGAAATDQQAVQFGGETGWPLLESSVAKAV